MPTIINASTSAGLIQSADTSAILELQTANLPAVTINASQNTTVNNNLTVNSNLTVTGTTTLNSSVVRSDTAKAWNWNGSSANTFIDFTSIPSWVKRITVMYFNLSTSGSSPVQIQLGTGATPTYTTSGYVGSVGRQTTGVATNIVTTGIAIDGSTGVAASTTRQGTTTLTLINATSYQWVGTTIQSSPDQVAYAASSIALPNTLTAVRITTGNGTDTFDAGSINILFE